MHAWSQLPLGVPVAKPDGPGISSLVSATPNITARMPAGVRTGHLASLYIGGTLDAATTVTDAMVSAKLITCTVANAQIDGTFTYTMRVNDGKQFGAPSLPLVATIDVP